MSHLGLVFRDEVIYAVCTLKGREHVRQLPLHGLLTASLTEEASDRLAGFNLDAYVRNYFDYPMRVL